MKKLIYPIVPFLITSCDQHLQSSDFTSEESFTNGVEGPATDYVNHNILEIDLISKEVEIFANELSANQPNDIAISPNGVLYASDPNWSDNTGNLWMITKEKGFELL